MATTINCMLAATDLSQPSLPAVDRGFQMAQEAKAHYTVLHAVGLDALGPLSNLLGGEAKHGTHVTKELLLGSVTKRLLFESSCDVLVLVDRRGPSAKPA